MNWEVISWTCITVAVLVLIGGLILMFISARNLKKSASSIKTLQTDLKIGTEVMFCGGIYGKVVKVSEETVLVEVSKNVIVKVSRYALQTV
ncbi:MAG: preprotein translocase subunit YajC [Clostridium sp.]|uniref:preprotein translocase subunit YajC n=1 Tax=Clostridium sp. TaxID=1506 RepID=UPI003EE5E9F7